MIYDLVFVSMNYRQELRTVLGLSDKELPDSDIDTDSVAGQAEVYVLQRVPNYATLDSTGEFNVNMAIIYMMAYFVIPSLKLKLLQSETDNKSTASRFKDAIAMLDKDDYLRSAHSYIASAVGVIESVPQFTAVKPATDVITGGTQ